MIMRLFRFTDSDPCLREPVDRNSELPGLGSLGKTG